MEAALLFVRLDEVVEASVASAEDQILPMCIYEHSVSETDAAQTWRRDTHLRRRRTGQKSFDPSPT